MSMKIKIAFHENDFQYKIDQKLREFQTHRNIYKTQKNAKNNVKILKKHQPHLMKRVSNKLRAFQMRWIANDLTKKDAPRSKQDMHFIIDHIMMMQHTIMQLSERLNRYTRLHLMFIFLQSFFLIIFNSYNLVMYVLRCIANRSVEFGLVEALLFYGYQIVAPLLEVVVTVGGFTYIYSSIEKTPNIIHALTIYARDANFRTTLFQYATLIRSNLRKYSIYGMYFLDGTFISATVSVTTTYIIILIQYGTPEFLGNFNETHAIN